MRLPMVSIIVPCYRQGHLLPEAVASALDQTHSAVQVIVVNDGSDDNTDVVAREFGDRITYISQRNGGLPAARNAGIRAAQGDYLLCLDADDRLHPQAVEYLLAAAAPDRLVLGQFEYFSDDPSVHIPRRLGGGGDPLAEGLDATTALLIGNLAAPCAHLCPRQAAFEIGLFNTDAKYYGCEDWDFWTRLVFHGLHAQRVPQVVSFYRLHAASMTHRNAARMAESDIRLVRRNLHAVTSGPAGRIADRSIGRVEIARRLRKKLRRELVGLAYLYRTRHSFTDAGRAVIRAAWWGGIGNRELIECMKLAVTVGRASVAGFCSADSKRKSGKS